MDSEKLARYLSGHGSVAERSEIETWAGASASQNPEMIVVSKILASGPKNHEWNIDSAWNKISTRLEDQAVESVPTIELRPRSTAIRWLAAAAIVGAVGIGVWQLRREAPAPAPAQSYVTQIGVPKTVTLSDGSSITLAPSSKLIILEGYGDKVRRVQLSGRAWFNVVHDSSRPFEVLVGGLRIVDIGTEFDVDSSANEITIAVRTGSVAVWSPAGDSTVLGPKDAVTVTLGASSQMKVDRQTVTDDLGAWKQGTLAFTNQTLGEVGAELERWYAVKIVIAPSLMQRRVSFDVTADMALEDVLAVIAAVDPSATVRIEGKTAYLDERPDR